MIEFYLDIINTLTKIHEYLAKNVAPRV